MDSIGLAALERGWALGIGTRIPRLRPPGVEPEPQAADPAADRGIAGVANRPDRGLGLTLPQPLRPGHRS